MEHRSALRSLIALDAFAAISALAGGLMVISGWPYAFPASWLRGTPFDGYVIPGVLLAVVVGGSAALSTVAMMRRALLGPTLSVIAGLVMMGWISGEIVLLDQNVGFTPLWPLYFVVGLGMTLLRFRVAPGGLRSLGHILRHA
jgi:hypothetical protein